MKANFSFRDGLGVSRSLADDDDDDERREEDES